MSQHSHFLYPLNPKAGYVLEGKGEMLATSRENFFRLLDYRVLSEWGVKQGAAAIKKGDFVWVHFSAPDSAICAVGRVAMTATWKVDWNRYSIKIRWDKNLTNRLRDNPIPLSEYGQVPYVSVTAANQRTSLVLSRWLNGKISSATAKRDEVVAFKTAEVLQRMGQPEFRASLLRAYENTCAITGCKVSDVLEAAHIKPISKNSSSLKNGILLRADIHNLFDLGLLTVDGSYRVILDESIQSSKEYRKLHGQHLVKIPKRPADRPSKSLLKQHRDAFHI